jgi:hypothetical protein
VADREDLPNFSRFGIVLSFPSEEALDHFYRKNLAQSPFCSMLSRTSRKKVITQYSYPSIFLWEKDGSIFATWVASNSNIGYFPFFMRYSITHIQQRYHEADHILLRSCSPELIIA